LHGYGSGAVVGRGGNGVEEGEGREVSMDEFQFQEDNKRHMTGSNRMETITMMMKKTKNDVDIVHV
jgi:hypothetical protein